MSRFVCCRQFFRSFLGNIFPLSNGYSSSGSNDKSDRLQGGKRKDPGGGGNKEGKLQTKQTRHKVTGPRQEYKEMSTLCARSRTPVLLVPGAAAAPHSSAKSRSRKLYTSQPPTRLPLTQLSPTNQTTRQPTHSS